MWKVNQLNIMVSNKICISSIEKDYDVLGRGSSKVWLFSIAASENLKFEISWVLCLIYIIFFISNKISATSKFGDEKCVMINDKDMIYFGMKDYCESTQWNEQYALLRHEETFDITIPNANRLDEVFLKIQVTKLP